MMRRLAAYLAIGMALPVCAQPDPSALSVAPGGIASDLRLQTSLRAGIWTHKRDFSDQDLTAVGAFRARISPQVGAVDGFAEAHAQIDSSGRADADLVEAWARLRAGNLDIKLGRQIVVWGRADRLNPTDSISARDYTLLTATDDDQRRGSFMLQARLGIGQYTFDAYWLPEFRPTNFPLDRAQPGIDLLPDQSVQDASQYALKLDSSGGPLDWSVSWFHGIDRTRDFVRVTPSAPVPVQIQQQFPAVDVFGADVAGTAGTLGYRAEIAYTHVRAPDSIFVKNSNLWLVAGIDTTLANGLNLNLQYSFRRIFGWRDPRLLANPIDRAVASRSAAVNNQLDRTQNGVTFRAAKAFRQDTIAAEISAIAWLETGDAAIRPKLSWSLTDSLRLTAGADIFVGPKLSAFGRIRSLSGGYLHLSYGY